jgi:hypothetical protein
MPRWKRHEHGIGHPATHETCGMKTEARLSKLEAHSSAQGGSAALSCGKPAAFRPVPQPPSKVGLRLPEFRVVVARPRVAYIPTKTVGTHAPPARLAGPSVPPAMRAVPTTGENCCFPRLSGSRSWARKSCFAPTLLAPVLYGPKADAERYRFHLGGPGPASRV